MGLSNYDKFKIKHEITIRKARDDLYTFTRFLFAQIHRSVWQEAPHHQILCDALMRVYNGQCKRLIINIPPRYSKTEIAVVNFIAWAMGKQPDSQFIHASYSSTLAVKNSSNIRTLVTSETYREIFPETILDSEAKAHWTTTQNGVMYATGAGGTITGFGAGKMRDDFGGAIIIDDPHKADEARSETRRNNVIDWFCNTIESRKNHPQKTPIILIMQRLHENDLSGFLLNGGNGEEWEHLCLPAIQADGTALWHEKHSIDDLRLMERANPYVFAGQYLQRPSPLSGGVFKPDNLVTVDAVPANVKTWVRGWDFAASDGKGDYTVGALIGLLDDNRVIIADVVRGQWATDERDAVLVNTARRDGRTVIQSIPQDAGAAGKSQVQYWLKSLGGLNVQASLESGDKLTRAEPFAAQVNVGNVLILKSSWNHELIEEMRLFPNGVHDDQIDACSRAYSELIDNNSALDRFRALAKKEF